MRRIRHLLSLHSVSDRPSGGADAVERLTIRWMWEMNKKIVANRFHEALGSYAQGFNLFGPHAQKHSLYRNDRGLFSMLLDD